MKRTALILLMLLAVAAGGVWLGMRIAATPPGSLAVPGQVTQRARSNL